VLPRAGDQTSTQFTRSLTKAVWAVAPLPVEVALECSVADRRVSITPADEPGMANLYAFLPAPEAMRVKAAIWRLGATRKTEADLNAADRTGADHTNNTQVTGRGRQLVSVTSDQFCPIDPATGEVLEFRPGDSDPTQVEVDPALLAQQCRADALVELADRYLSDSDPSGVINRTHPITQVTVSLATLIGASDEPGELAGYGPIPATLARRIAADPDGTWRRLVTDPLGQLIDYGRTRYTPPTDLDQFARARDVMCVFPNCNRQAEACDLDHTLAWDHDGETNPDNLAPLCRRHHRTKHQANWTYQRLPDGTIEWTSPTGHKYQNPPPQLPGAAEAGG
jgi:hypothetical protein